MFDLAITCFTQLQKIFLKARIFGFQKNPGCYSIEGVDVEDVEAATSIHQHLGEALLADNGVDDDHVAVGSRWRLEEGE